MRGFVLGLLVSGIALQGAPKPPPPIYGFLDTPSPFEIHDYTPDFMFGGWILDCRTGETPPFVTVEDFWMGADGTGMTIQEHSILPSFTIFRDQHRPDAQAAAIGTCPLASDHMGYAVYPNATLKGGLHALVVEWTAGDGIAQHTQVFVRVPVTP